MSETLKEFMTKKSKLDKYSLLDDCENYDTFMKNLDTLKGQASYASPAETKPIIDKDHEKGLITLKAFFSKDRVGDFDGEIQEWVKDLNKFLKKYGNWEVNNFTGDNTYNFNSPMEDYIAMRYIDIVNPKSKAFECKTVVLFSVCKALDPRGDYSPSCIGIFDNDENDDYNLISFLNVLFGLFSCTVEYKGQKYSFDVEGAAYLNYYTVTCFNDELEDPAFDIESKEDYNFDPDDIKQSIVDFINDNQGTDINTDDIKILNPEFYCEEED